MAKSKTILLVANGDLRQSANEVCWPAQNAMEQALTAAVAKLGYKLVRAHPYKPALKHGFIASQKEGIVELREKIETHSSSQNNERKTWLLAEKAYQLLKNKRMADVNKQELKEAVEKEGPAFNLYRFVENFR